jgi:hypothetical protein
MKIKSIAAVGALGVGLGVASFIGGTGTASAACEDTTPPLTPARVTCVAAEQGNIFINSVNPVNQLGILINGTAEEGPADPVTGDPTTVRSGLGLIDQPATFVGSVGDFLNGPRSPDPGPTAAGPDAGPPA